MFTSLGLQRKSSVLSLTRRTFTATAFAAALLVFYALISRKTATLDEVLRRSGLHVKPLEQPFEKGYRDDADGSVGSFGYIVNHRFDHESVRSDVDNQEVEDTKFDMPLLPEPEHIEDRVQQQLSSTQFEPVEPELPLQMLVVPELIRRNVTEKNSTIPEWRERDDIKTISTDSELVNARSTEAETAEREPVQQKLVGPEMNVSTSTITESTESELTKARLAEADTAERKAVRSELAEPEMRKPKPKIPESTERGAMQKRSTESELANPTSSKRSMVGRKSDQGAAAKGKQGSSCLRSIIYDKPVKTASTAITYAIREYLHSTGRFDLKCNMDADSCLKQSERICLGTHARQNEELSLIGHLKLSNGTAIHCLRRMGYYAVTSIRSPYERRRSAYLYNKTVKGRHYGISHTSTFREFMDKLPRCILHHDYDGLGPDCDVGITLKERVRRIADRYDEVIELGGDLQGPLYKKIKGFVARENESKKVDLDEEFDFETLKEESMLYNALRGKMMGRIDNKRMPC